MTLLTLLTGPTAGLWMLLVLGLLIVTTGLPVWALLVGVASGFAALGLGTGVMDLGILAALPGRLVGLLEHDLLQAMPLYVFVGVLLQRLTVADALLSSLARAFRPLGSGPSQSLAALGVGALLAPMNGSVASSSALLSRLVAPRLGHMLPARATVLISAAATVGVVVPPSLVLILLGDAMMRAHTEASNLPGFSATAAGGIRIINTQDVLHAALIPAACVLLLWALVACWQARGVVIEDKPVPDQPLWAQAAMAVVAVAVIAGLLGGVFTGQLYAVEAAATGGVLLLLLTLLSRALTMTQWQDTLLETLSLSGSLFALLVGATTFSLVFRLFGTDQYLTSAVLGSPFSPVGTAAAMLLLVALCAWVLDAFEMIFVIIPILAPALIARLGDAQQAAVLLLLVLQLSFLVPPMGYALLMVRARSGLPAVTTRHLLTALWPMLLAQLAVTVAVFAFPGVVHTLDSPLTESVGGAPPSDEDIAKQMLEMSRDGAGDLPATTEKPGQH